MWKVAVESDKPCHHVVIDGMLTSDDLEQINKEWPTITWPGWVTYKSQYSTNAQDTCHIQLSTKHVQVSNLTSPIPIPCALAIRAMATSPAIWSISPDSIPDLSLLNAGICEIQPGSELEIHLESDHHPRLHLERVLCLILFIHPKWEQSWGGKLQLYNEIQQLGTTNTTYLHPSLADNTRNMETSILPPPLLPKHSHSTLPPIRTVPTQEYHSPPCTSTTTTIPTTTTTISTISTISPVPQPATEITPIPGRLIAFDCRYTPNSISKIHCPPHFSYRYLTLFCYGLTTGPQLRPYPIFLPENDGST